MPAKVFIDTNIVIYALGPASDKASVVAPLLVGRPTISTQVLTEVTNVVSKRLAMPFAEIRRLLTKLEALCQVELINAKTIHSGLMRAMAAYISNRNSSPRPVRCWL